MLRILVFASLGWLGLQIVLIGYTSRMVSLGRPTISWPALLAAKIAVALSLVWMVWTAASGEIRLSPVSTGVFLTLLLGGTLLMTLGLFHLGRNLRVGLPDEKTVLVTSGVFGISRNPIYAGVFCLMGASLVCAFSWVNLVAVVVGVLLHHRIVLAEEKFLARQFKDYEAYRGQVRRYL